MPFLQLDARGKCCEQQMNTKGQELRDLIVPTIHLKLCVFHLFTFVEQKHFPNLSKLFKHKTDFYRNSHVSDIVYV